MFRSCFSSQNGHITPFTSAFSSWTLSVVFEAYDFIFFFKLFFSYFSRYTLGASQEKSGSLANKVSSLMQSIKSANSRPLTLHHQIGKTFLFLLSLVFFGSFDVSVQRMFGEFREFHCCCDIIFSHFIKRLKNFWYVDESPGFSNSEALIFFVFAANILWGSPYCCSNSNLALSYPMPYGCWMFQFPH